jgi:hypothetical protein
MQIHVSYNNKSAKTLNRACRGNTAHTKEYHLTQCAKLSKVAPTRHRQHDNEAKAK